MPLYDDLRNAGSGEMTRRRFMGAVGTCALTASGVGTAAAALSYMEPNVLFEEETRFKVGKLDEWPPGVHFLPRRKIYLVREPAGIYALNAKCTHLGCMTRHEEGGFFCPCHGSRFALSGAGLVGPAVKPLPRLAMSLERGVLVVDRAMETEPTFVLQV
jgi:Rieske Fe-S protein